MTSFGPNSTFGFRNQHESRISLKTKSQLCSKHMMPKKRVDDSNLAQHIWFYISAKAQWVRVGNEKHSIKQFRVKCWRRWKILWQQKCSRIPRSVGSWFVFFRRLLILSHFLPFLMCFLCVAHFALLSTEYSTSVRKITDAEQTTVNVLSFVTRGRWWPFSVFLLTIEAALLNNLERNQLPQPLNPNKWLEEIRNTHALIFVMTLLTVMCRGSEQKTNEEKEKTRG